MKKDVSDMKKIEKLEHEVIDYERGIGYSVSLDDVINKLNEVIDVLNGEEDVSNMDYEKEARETFAHLHPEMLGWAKAHYSSFSDEDKQFWESIFPELRESEDERIRKMLVEQMERWKNCAEDNNVEQDVKDASAAIAWLEKQKEQEPITDSVKFEEGFKAGREFERREQKPAEWSEEDEKKIHFLSNLIEFQTKDGVYCFGGKAMINKQGAIDMLKSLRPQPKQEWSEEDKRKLSRLYSLVGCMVDTNPRLIGDKEAIELEDFLKALRPHWKPGEEQMAGLLAAIGDEKERGSDVAKTLHSLYEQLKAL